MRATGVLRLIADLRAGVQVFPLEEAERQLRLLVEDSLVKFHLEDGAFDLAESLWVGDLAVTAC